MKKQRRLLLNRMCTANCVAGDCIRSMEVPSCGSPEKERSRNFWNRRTSIFHAMPTLLSLYFFGAGITFIVCTQTFVSSFQFFSPESQATLQLFPVSSTFFPGQGTVIVPEKSGLEVLEELQGPTQSLHDEDGANIFPVDTKNASSSQIDFNAVEEQVADEADTLRDERSSYVYPADAKNASSLHTNSDPVEAGIAADEEEEYDSEPEFMQSPIISKSKRQRATSLQSKLKRMSSSERRRWVVQNWQNFPILNVDNLSNQFTNRMREFFCTYNQTPHLNLNLNLANSSLPREENLTQEILTMHKMDEEFICNTATPQGASKPAFCTQRFFLTWMSPVASFTPRERLGLESIFKHNPRACVVILSRTMDSEEGSKILSPFAARGYRIMAATPDVSALFANSPAAWWLKRVREGLQDPGCINLMQNLSNLMRLAALHEYGGTYVDTDVIVVRAMAQLRNAIGAQSSSRGDGDRWTRLNNAVLVFDRAHPLVLEFLREFASSFDGSRWGWNGPYLVSRVADRVLQVSPLHFSPLPLPAAGLHLPVSFPLFPLSFLCPLHFRWVIYCNSFLLFKFLSNLVHSPM